MMVDLHFKSSGHSPKCIHVYARSKSDLQTYLQYLYRRGERHQYELNQIKDGYSDFMGTSRTVPKEVNSILKNLAVLDSSNKPNKHGELLAKAIDTGRPDLFEDGIIQHMRAFPTIAYIIDILRQEEIVAVEELTEKLRQASSVDSTFEQNSVRNCLNLLADFDVVELENSQANIISRNQTTIEAVAHALVLLTKNNASINSSTLRDKLPVLLHCSQEGAEEMFRRARSRYSMFTYRTLGDSSRMQPYGGVFEVEVGDVTPKDLQSTLL